MTARSALCALALAPALAFGTAASAQDAASIRLLASNCANCHGTDGRSQGGMPPLAGEPKAKLLGLLQDFKTGRKPATVMHQISKGYTDAELDALATYFSTQKP